MFAFVWLMLLSYSCLVNSKDLPHDFTLQGKNIFILAGQSNMAGRGGVVNGTWDGLVPPESGPYPMILRLNAGLMWEEANEPLHQDIDVHKTCGVGPGMAFANAVLRKDSSIGLIGLVPCAVGGTNISEWQGGSYLYGQMMRRAQAALQGGGRIRALLWYQGEADTVEYEDAELYKNRLERFFTHVRADLSLPMLPIIQVALASGQGPYIEIIRRAQLGTQLPNVKCVDAKGLELNPDGLHLTTSAQVQLGEILANAFHRNLPLPVESGFLNTIRLHSFVLKLLQLAEVWVMIFLYSF